MEWAKRHWCGNRQTGIWMASSSNLGLGEWALPMLSSLPLIPNIGLSVERKNQLSHFCRRVSHRCRNGPETV